MLLRQYYLGCLAHASYLVADEQSTVAAVVDPQRDVAQYVEEAEARGLAIRYVFLTHFHADFLAGHLELRDRCGATICLGARAEAEYVFRAFASGEVLELGPEVRLEVLETPGHSPESISIAVHRAGAEVDPYAVLTGDTLFVGDVGRPDLRAALGWQPEDLGSLLYDSVQSLLALPDETLVYPAHGAGSLCGKNLGEETVTTIGVQRRYNYALQPTSRDEFVRIVLADQPHSPAYFTYDAVLNTRERATLETALERALAPLGLEKALALAGAGAQVLDVREAAEFAGAHLAGAVNVGLGGSFATWCGTLLSSERPIVLVADPGREEEAATRLGRIGFDHVAGYLDGGMQALEGRPDLVARVRRITAAALADELSGEEQPLLLDVRTEREWRESRIAGSLNIPLNRLPGEAASLPRRRPIVVHCATDYRSTIAASLLARVGLEATVLTGGLGAWEASRLATV